MTPRIVPALLAGAALALGACGGSDNKSSGSSSSSSADAARGYSGNGPVQSVQEYLDAFASGDYAKACGYIGNDSKKKIEAAGSCEDVLKKAAGQVKGTDADMKGAKAAPGTIASDQKSGTVKVTTRNGIKIEIPVLIEDNRWKVNRGTS